METNLLIAPSQNMMMVRSNDWKQDVEDAVLIREQPQKDTVQNFVGTIKYFV